MARAGNLLSTALSVQQTADLVARLVVPELADWCFVELVQDDGGSSASRCCTAIRTEQAGCAGSTSSSRSTRTRRRVAAVIRSGEPEVLPEIGDEFLAARRAVRGAPRDPARAGLHVGADRPARRARPDARRHRAGDRRDERAPADAPRRCRSRGRSPTAAPWRWTTRWPTTSARSSRCRCRRSCCRATCRRSRASTSPPATRRRGRATRSAATSTTSSPPTSGWQVVIGDVVGKGPAAAAVTGLARHTLRAAAAYERSPRALLHAAQPRAAGRGARPPAGLGRVPAPRPGGATRSRLTLSVGGHPLPLLVRADGSVREIGTHGRLLGVDDEALLDGGRGGLRARRPARALHRRRRRRPRARRLLRRGPPARARRRRRERRPVARRAADRVRGARRLRRPAAATTSRWSRCASASPRTPNVRE